MSPISLRHGVDSEHGKQKVSVVCLVERVSKVMTTLYSTTSYKLTIESEEYAYCQITGTRRSMVDLQLYIRAFRAGVNKSNFSSKVYESFLFERTLFICLFCSFTWKVSCGKGWHGQHQHLKLCTLSVLT